MVDLGWDQYETVDQLGRLGRNLGWIPVASVSSNQQITLVLRRDGRPDRIEEAMVYQKAKPG